MTSLPSAALPSGAWEALFPRALTLIAEVRTHGGVDDPFWTLGGGTVLMFRYRHRLSTACPAVAICSRQELPAEPSVPNW